MHVFLYKNIHLMYVNTILCSTVAPSSQICARFDLRQTPKSKYYRYKNISEMPRLCLNKIYLNIVQSNAQFSSTHNIVLLFSFVSLYIVHFKMTTSIQWNSQNTGRHKLLLNWLTYSSSCVPWRSNGDFPVHQY